MEKRLIDANEINLFFYEGCDRFTLKDLLESEPTVDAVEVVRCKDCKHCECITWDSRIGDEYTCELGRTMFINPDHFCSYGERRDQKCK